MELEFKYSLQNIASAAHFVIDNLIEHKILLLDGSMGAGKTTLTKAICSELTVVDTVSSPTFSIVNEYLDSNNNSIYHFDFYRLDDVEEALQIGVEDYFYSGNLCIIEWASRVENIIPDDFILVSLEIENEQKRKLTITYGR